MIVLCVINSITVDKSVESVVKDHPWEIAAYRFSLMTMLADLEEIRSSGQALDPLINSEVDFEFDTKGEMVDFDTDGETWSMTKGRYRRSLEVKEDE